MTCDIGNPGHGLEQAQKCGRVIPVTGIPTVELFKLFKLSFHKCTIVLMSNIAF
jgi:hypothetical protein